MIKVLTFGFLFALNLQIVFSQTVEIPRTGREAEKLIGGLRRIGEQKSVLEN
jgi:hypothetical protein